MKLRNFLLPVVLVALALYYLMSGVSGVDSRKLPVVSSAKSQIVITKEVIPLTTGNPGKKPQAEKTRMELLKDIPSINPSLCELQEKDIFVRSAGLSSEQLSLLNSALRGSGSRIKQHEAKSMQIAQLADGLTRITVMPNAEFVKQELMKIREVVAVIFKPEELDIVMEKLRCTNCLRPNEEVYVWEGEQSDGFINLRCYPRDRPTRTSHISADHNGASSMADPSHPNASESDRVCSYPVVAKRLLEKVCVRWGHIIDTVRNASGP